jgi:hypothetical protein
MMRTAVVAVLTAAVALSGAPVAGAARPAALRIVRSWPLELRGTGFHAGERVTVTVRMDSGRWTAQTHAGSGGAFTQRFGRLRLHACSLPLVVKARGARGEVAYAPLPPRECAAP